MQVTSNEGNICSINQCQAKPPPNPFPRVHLCCLGRGPACNMGCTYISQQQWHAEGLGGLVCLVAPGRRHETPVARFASA